MMDTGTSEILMLNNRLIPLGKENFLSTGSAKSGQVLEVYASSVSYVSLNNSNIRFDSLPKVLHTDFGFMQESIHPGTLGTFGYGFFKDHILTIDYNRQIITVDTIIPYHNPNYYHSLSIPFYYGEKFSHLPRFTVILDNSDSMSAYFDIGDTGG